MSKALTSKYAVNIWWSDEDRVYIAEAPELPGCMAHGKTRDAALASLNDAMDLWLKTARQDGIVLPQPRKHMVPA